MTMKILPDDYLSRNRNRQPVKKIEHPSIGTLCWLLLPCFAGIVIGFVLYNFPMWIFGVEIGSLILFLVTATYFCTKQKCYKQLWATYATIIIFLVPFIGRQYVRIYFDDKYEQIRKEMPVKADESPDSDNKSL